MTENTQDRYNVVLEGSPVAGVSPQQAALKIAKLFDKPVEQIIPLLKGKPTTIKSSLSHAKAFEFQQTLIQAGASTRLVRIPREEKAAEFSLVPEGEEQTPYEELAARYSQGETVICIHCNTEQTLAPYCAECGKQLLAKKGHGGDEAAVVSRNPLLKWGGVVLVLIVAAVVIYFAGFK